MICARPDCHHDAVGDQFCSASCCRAMNNAELPAVTNSPPIRNTRPDTLRCYVCDEWKPDEAFHRGGSKRPSRRGRHQLCKPCSNAARRKYAHEHPEQEQARWREQNRRARERRKAEA